MFQLLSLLAWDRSDQKLDKRTTRQTMQLLHSETRLFLQRSCSSPVKIGALILGIGALTTISAAAATVSGNDAATPAASMTPMTSMASSPMQGMSTKPSYFMAHSFDFARMFRAFHPGPTWILQHGSELHLTTAQTEALKRLQVGMRVAVASSSSQLRKAMAEYEKDSKATLVKEKRILDDIQEVGKAQTKLAGAMVPYHLGAYGLLNDSQKTTYDRLVAAGP